VIKNTLFKLAAIDAGIEGMDALLDGPAAVAFIHGDPVAAAKSVVAAAKKHPALELKGGFMEGHLLTAEQARALADLESREVMLSKIAGMMKSEMGRAASMFQATQARFLSLLEAFKEKLPAEEATAEEATAEEAVAGEAAVWEADQQAEPEQSTEEE
jgi:large subunit ribosomal protein L10